MIRTICFFTALLLAAGPLSAETGLVAGRHLVPTPTQLAWQEAELGVLVCYELHTFQKHRYNQRRARIESIEDTDIFNPVLLDTDQWIRTARDMGAKFAILTASHESGFRLWRSDANTYSLKRVKWAGGKRDIVGEFVASCRKYGIKPGIYLGTRWNAHLGIFDFRVTKRSPITQKAYNALIEKEVEEICTRYGDLFEIWFDGGAYGPKDGGPDVLSIVEKHQPKALFYRKTSNTASGSAGSRLNLMPAENGRNCRRAHASGTNGSSDSRNRSRRTGSA